MMETQERKSMQRTAVLILYILSVFLLASCGASSTQVDENPAILDEAELTAVAEKQDEVEVVSFSQLATSTPFPEGTSRYTRMIAFGRPAIGEALFNTFQDEAGFACSTCHRHDSEAQLVGPGLLNIGIRAETRIQDLPAADYVFQSILEPDAHIVEGFSADLMPENWGEIYTLSEINDIVAYLMTLQGEATETAEVSDGDSSETAALDIPAELPETADASHGAELFTTFQPDAGFACSTCHRDNSEDRLIGPGLLNVGTRAETRVEGLTPVQYLYTSIVNPDAYLVEEFDDDLMPENWAEIYTDEEIYDIIAYLLTLQE